ncbi:Uncharacterised protein [Prevotella melaninogenica]|nr:Uncharacterised protein [Prevotella melaninogenica]
MAKDKENTKRQSTELVVNCDLILELLSRTWVKSGSALLSCATLQQLNSSRKLKNNGYGRK